MSLSIKLGNFLFKNAFFLYQPMYAAFKKKQDAFELSLLKKYIRPGDVILDIGANIGFYARILAQLTGPHGKVHCFEPDKKNYAHLQKNTADLANVTINNSAVGPVTGTLTVYTSAELNVDHRTYKPEHYDNEFQIPSVAIDDYIQKVGLKKVDLVKIDIQGFEMEAVKGMTELLRSKDLRIISEFWPYGLRTAGSSATAYFNHFISLGYNCYLLDANQLTLLTETKVKALEPLGKEHYFNILITRGDV
jgi:FkbM family methyltransferase